jgi:hypothetical protein
MRWPWRQQRQADDRIEVRFGNPARVPARYDRLKAEVAIIEDQVRSGVAKAEGLTAAGMLVTHGQATFLRRLIQPWQIRAYGYYDILGEIHYAAQFYARALSNLELFAAEYDDMGQKQPTDNEEVKAALARVKDPGGTSRKGLLADYGRLMFLAGEALLLVWVNPQTELEQWEMLSTDELRLLDGSYTRFVAPSLPAMQFMPAPDDAFVPVGKMKTPKGQWEGYADEDAVAYRLWKRHPRFSALPDAPMMAVLELCEELVLLTHAVRARARSRLAGSGILFIDDRITTRPQEAVPDEDFQEDIFLEDLTEAMTSPIVDEGTASAVVPLVARVKVPEGVKLQDLVYHLQVVDPMALYPETGLRQECVRRIAICLDMPPEILLGLGQLNHWNIWGIDEQSWKYHLQPMAEHLVSDLTSAYMGPYLKEQGVADWTKYCIDYDASKVINHPDRSKDAKDLHDRGVIGDTALRDATGFTDADKPTKDELARIVGMAVHDSSLAWDGVPSVRGTVEPTAGELVSPPGPGGTSGGGDEGSPVQSTGASVEKGPPKGGPPADETSEGFGASAHMITGAAQFALLRAREAAGARLRSAARRDHEATVIIDASPKAMIAAELGREKVRELLGGRREAELVADARPLMLEVLRQFGLDSDAACEVIADAIEAHAARTLYERTARLPGDFPTYVERVIAASRSSA